MKNRQIDPKSWDDVIQIVCLGLLLLGQMKRKAPQGSPGTPPPPKQPKPDPTLLLRSNGLDPDDIHVFNVADLKRALKLLGEPLSGKKADLIDRVKRSIQQSTIGLVAQNEGVLLAQQEVDKQRAALTHANQLRAALHVAYTEALGRLEAGKRQCQVEQELLAEKEKKLQEAIENAKPTMMRSQQTLTSKKSSPAEKAKMIQLMIQDPEVDTNTLTTTMQAALTGTPDLIYQPSFGEAFSEPKIIVSPKEVACAQLLKTRCLADLSKFHWITPGNWEKIVKFIERVCINAGTPMTRDDADAPAAADQAPTPKSEPGVIDLTAAPTAPPPSTPTPPPQPPSATLSVKEVILSLLDHGILKTQAKSGDKAGMLMERCKYADSLLVLKSAIEGRHFYIDGNVVAVILRNSTGPKGQRWCPNVYRCVGFLIALLYEKASTSPSSSYYSYSYSSAYDANWKFLFHLAAYINCSLANQAGLSAFVEKVKSKLNTVKTVTTILMPGMETWLTEELTKPFLNALSPAIAPLAQHALSFITPELSKALPPLSNIYDDRRLKCTCQICVPFRAFLRSEKLQEYFDLPKMGRWHLHDRCNEVGRLSHNSTGSGRNRVLVITKATKREEENRQAERDSFVKAKMFFQQRLDSPLPVPIP